MKKTIVIDIPDECIPHLIDELDYLIEKVGDILPFVKDIFVSIKGAVA